MLVLRVFDTTAAMARLCLLIAIVLVASAFTAPAAVADDDACGDLTSQLALQNQRLDELETDEVSLLQVSVSLLTVASDLSEPEAGSVVRVFAEMQLLLSGMDTEPPTSFLSQVGEQLPEWQSRLVVARSAAPASSRVALLNTTLRQLDEISPQVREGLDSRDNLTKALTACRPTSVPAAGQAGWFRVRAAA